MIKKIALITCCAAANAETVITTSEVLTANTDRILIDNTIYKDGACIKGTGYKIQIDGANNYALIFDLNGKGSDYLIECGTLELKNLTMLQVKDTVGVKTTPSRVPLMRTNDQQLYCDNIGKIYLNNNYYTQETSFFYSFNSSSANSQKVMMRFSNIDEIRMTNNRTGHDWGTNAAIAGFFAAVNRGDLLIENVKSFVIENNRMDNFAFGGLIFTMEGRIDWRNVDDIVIKNNMMTNSKDPQYGCMGGAIMSSRSLSFANCGNILFENNGVINGSNSEMTYLPLLGGAIFAANIFSSNQTIEEVLFSADGGDITFKGNYKNDRGRVELDSVFMSKVNTFTVRAATGREVTFYDKITADVIRIVFNEDDEEASPGVRYDGSIRFSGEYMDQYIVQGQEIPDETDEMFTARRWDSRYSYLGADVAILQGSFTVDHEAAIGVAPLAWDAEKTTWQNLDAFSQDHEMLAFENATAITVGNIPFKITTEGMMMGKDISVRGTGTVFRTDGSGVFVAGNVDMSRGVSYDFDYSLTLADTSRASVNPYLASHSDAPSGIIISAQALSLGGDFMVADTSRSYTNRFWAVDREFLVLKDVNQARDGSAFDAILSTITQSNEVRDPHQYQGDWSLRWYEDDLYAIWSKTADIEEPEPEEVQTGSLVENTLWVTMSNMKALSEAAAQQMNYLRYLENTCRHVWVSGLGDFLNQDSNGAVNGFTYKGAGAAMGIDSYRCKNFVGGVALGFMDGNMNIRMDNARADLESLMASAYAGYRNKLNEHLDFYWVSTLSGVRTTSDALTVFDSGEQVFGKWHNTGIMLESRATWNYALSDNSFLSPHIGIEYVFEKREAFDETGNMDRARHFGKTDLKNLRLPVGMSWTDVLRFSDRKVWTNTFDASLLFDVSRSNPEGVAHSLINDFNYSVHAANPAREALRVSWTSFYKWNDNWGIFGGYNAELRKNAIYQQVNVGVSCSF